MLSAYKYSEFWVPRTTKMQKNVENGAFSVSLVAIVRKKQ